MEPLTVATTFASIVGLLQIYKSEVRARTTDDITHFLEWLTRHKHDTVVDLIRDNKQLLDTLRATLDTHHEELVESLAKFDMVLTTIADHLGILKPVAQSIRVEEYLSEQAIGLLRQLNDANASSFIVANLGRGGVALLVNDGKGGQLSVPESRFLDDDLATLDTLGLLRMESTSRGGKKFTITRAGAAIAGNSN